MPKTPCQIHMYDMVKIDTIVFEIVTVWNSPDRIGLTEHILYDTIYL